MTKKRIIALVMAATMIFSTLALSGCSNEQSEEEMQQENQKLIDEADQMPVESDDK